MTYTKEILIQKIQQLHIKTSKTPTVEMIKKSKEMPSKSTYYRKFGSWNNALLEAGIKPNKPKYNRNELINYIQKLHNELEKTPTEEEMLNDMNTPSLTPFYNEFGNWNNAVQQAGLEPRTSTKSK